MSKSFTITVSNDHDAASVLLFTQDNTAMRAVVAELDPRQARRIAVDLLGAAQVADDQRVQNLRRAKDKS